MTEPTTEPTTEARFWAKVDASGDCWMWTAGQSSTGYGGFRFEDRWQGAHRVAYTLLVGPIPEGYELDHLCRVRRCVNPDHLEPVLHRENVVRGLGPVHQRAKTTCKRGHPFDAANTYQRDGRTHRDCRARDSLRKREARAAA